MNAIRVGSFKLDGIRRPFQFAEASYHGKMVAGQRTRVLSYNRVLKAMRVRCPATITVTILLPVPVYLFTFHGYMTWLPDNPRGYTKRGEGYRDPDDE